MGWRWCDLCARRFYDAEDKERCPVCGTGGTLLAMQDQAAEHRPARRQEPTGPMQTGPMQAGPAPA